jgi:hypothetical protein
VPLLHTAEESEESEESSFIKMLRILLAAIIYIKITQDLLHNANETILRIPTTDVF